MAGCTYAGRQRSANMLRMPLACRTTSSGACVQMSSCDTYVCAVAVYRGDPGLQSQPGTTNVFSLQAPVGGATRPPSCSTHLSAIWLQGILAPLGQAPGEAGCGVCMTVGGLDSLNGTPAGCPGGTKRECCGGGLLSARLHQGWGFPYGCMEQRRARRATET